MKARIHRFRQALARIGRGIGFAAGFSRKLLANRAVAVTLISITALWLYSRYVTELNLFVFMDSGQMTVHETYTQDVELALLEAGIHLNTHDQLRGEGPHVGGVSEIEIIRTQTVTILLDGKKYTDTSIGGSVLDALAKVGYEPRPNDVITPEPTARLEDGMVIEVTRITIRTEKVFAEIPFDEVRNLNSNINEGSEITIVEGKPGQTCATYEVVEKNGEEISRRLILEAVSLEPVARVVEVGTRAYLKMKDGTYLYYTKRLLCTATAYTTERQKNKINAIGNVARVGTIAVDPKVIPLRTNVYVTSANGKWTYGLARTEDTGGVIKGNKIDLFYNTWNECILFGVRKAYVYILD